jgi:hypothetical protein
VTRIIRDPEADLTGAGLLRDRSAEATASADQTSRAPVIVLAPAYAGSGALRSLLEGYPELGCTSGTGLLPLCDQAMATWSNADGRAAGVPSSLALASTRALASSVITSILAREGKRRWCEVAAVNASAAETFLRLYPETRFLCFYRACSGVIRAILDASPWGLTDPIFAAFTSCYPASTVASLAAYWVTATSRLLAFERQHPQSCLRVRFEDLSEEWRAEERIAPFLGLAGKDRRPISSALEEPPPAPRATPLAVGPPVDLIPPPLLAEANDLLQALGYPPMTETTRQLNH